MEMVKVFPENHWTRQVDIPYRMGLACDDLIFLCGQADLEGEGMVCNPDDLIAQSKSAIHHIKNLFAELSASMENLGKVLAEFGLSHSNVVKLNTYYQGSTGDDESVGECINCIGQ